MEFFDKRIKQAGESKIENELSKDLKNIFDCLIGEYDFFKDIYNREQDLDLKDRWLDRMRDFLELKEFFEEIWNNSDNLEMIDLWIKKLKNKIQKNESDEFYVKLKNKIFPFIYSLESKIKKDDKKQ